MLVESMNVKEQTQENKQESTSTQLVETVKLQGTPFDAVRYDETWIVTCGKYKGSDTFKNLDECLEAVTNPNWELIMIVISSLIEAYKENLDKPKTKKK